MNWALDPRGNRKGAAAPSQPKASAKKGTNSKRKEEGK